MAGMAGISMGGKKPGEYVPSLNVATQRPLGVGSTGRSSPNNLQEQLALTEAMSNPAAGKIIPTPLRDSRWPAAEGWEKMTQNINGTEIHYVRNKITGAIDDFKFK